MNLYLFIDAQNDDLSDSELWNEGLYHAAVWESSKYSAAQFAQEFYTGYNESWFIRQMGDPTKLSTNEDDSRWNKEWDY
jgi:hypothetical protein